MGFGARSAFFSWEKAHPNEIKPIIKWKNELFAADLTLFGLVYWSLLLSMGGLETRVKKQVRQRVLTGVFPSRLKLTCFQLAAAAGVLSGVLLGMAGIENWLWARHALPLKRALAQAEFESKKGMPEQYLGLGNTWESLIFKEVRSLEGRSSRRALFSWFIPTLGIVWFGARLFSRAFREQRFVFLSRRRTVRAWASVFGRGEGSERESAFDKHPSRLGVYHTPVLLFPVYPIFLSEMEPAADTLPFLWRRRSPQSGVQLLVDDTRLTGRARNLENTLRGEASGHGAGVGVERHCVEVIIKNLGITKEHSGPVTSVYELDASVRRTGQVIGDQSYQHFS